MYWTDYHHHTNNSFDSKAVMDEVCAKAVEKGIDEICFTEHFSVNPKAPTYGHMDFSKYISDIQHAKSKWQDNLKIKMGIELCEPHLMKDKYKEGLDGIEFDFILGSIHNIQEEKLRKYLFDKENHAAYLGYFEEVLKLVTNADIDVLAHFDLLKRYAMAKIGNYNVKDMEEIIRHVLHQAIKRDIGLEINTSGFASQSVGEAFPRIELLKLYKQMGGEILTIGSDSHRVETVGNYFNEALKMAKEAGFSYIYTFDKRKPEPIRMDDFIL
ncbi:histidinol-phosphatase HisJ family protein [Oceanobacillus iheyensis]|uniref:histidinol-phosphatase HisJ family protein n=1 Tax=Oceanobacillus iheyensis TaxID=182710 RepID=UPI00363F70ED